MNIVDEPSFRMLLSEADPRFNPPHRPHFATKVMPQMYVTVWDRIEEQLREVDHCTIATDLWISSHQHRSYVSLTIHFVDTEEFVPYNVSSFTGTYRGVHKECAFVNV